MTVHPAAQAFDRAADAYERARPGYPDEAVAWLAERLALGPGRTVVDLAAGTGKLTRALARTRAWVIAVDPAERMLERLRTALPDIEAHAGTAERMPLGDASADAVTVAQAFHWFDPGPAFAETHRVLRPGGRLALIWNRRDLTAPAHAALDAIFARYQGDTPRHRHSAWRPVAERTPLFTAAGELELPNEQRLDAAGLVERAASTSFIAALPESRRAEALAEVEALAQRLGEPIDLPHVTEIFVFARL